MYENVRLGWKHRVCFPEHPACDETDIYIPEMISRVLTSFSTPFRPSKLPVCIAEYETMSQFPFNCTLLLSEHVHSVLFFSLFLFSLTPSKRIPAEAIKSLKALFADQLITQLQVAWRPQLPRQTVVIIAARCLCKLITSSRIFVEHFSGEDLRQLYILLANRQRRYTGAHV